jgi:hypothetical protein
MMDEGAAEGGELADTPQFIVNAERLSCSGGPTEDEIAAKWRHAPATPQHNLIRA